ncbi:50S ribosomal protein L30 [Candidatus Woesearchaeota archaeon]|nr:50S ribosomal protein L30 [Candidatus Woesearchaeota archaeon]
MVQQEEIKKIRSLIKEKKLIIGTERTIKELKKKKLDKVYVSANVSQEVMDDINHYAKLADLSVVQLDVFNEELGTICKKPFSISVIGVLKQAND